MTKKEPVAGQSASHGRCTRNVSGNALSLRLGFRLFNTLIGILLIELLNPAC